MPSVSQPSATSPETVRATPRNSFRAPWSIFWVGFVVRALYVLIARTYHYRPYDDHFGFAWEMGRIARALVTGYGYSDPFRGHTGPTAWTAPVTPLILAAIFKMFGVYTNASALAATLLNCFFSALTARNTWEIAARCFNQRVARWSGWLWALYPAAMQYSVRWLWEMNLTVLLFTWILVLALRLRGIGGEVSEVDRLRLWLAFGLSWGALALNNPALTVLLPVTGLWVLVGLVRAGAGWAWPVRGATLAGVVCLLCLAPWLGRNWLVFHKFVPMRSNFGVELYLGDGPGTNGLLIEYLHPVRDPQQFRLYQQMGELAYSDYRGKLAKDYIRQYPGIFLKSTLKRVYFFWAGVPPPADYPWYVEAGRGLNFAFTSVAGLLGLGLALRRRVPGAWLFAGAFLFYPVTYYLVMALARFRHPLEPLITILAVYLFQSATPKRIDQRAAAR
jgi:hypothetical protein